MTPNLGTAGLTVQECGILATSASAAYPDSFSRSDRLPVSEIPVPTLQSRERTYSSRGHEFKVKWEDCGQPLPIWFDPLMQGFVDLLTLQPNWDSYGGGAIDPNLVNDAMRFMNTLLATDTVAPRVVPLSSGGLQLEWHRQGIDLEVIFDCGEKPYFYYRNRVDSVEYEHELPENNELLKTILRDLK